MGLRVVQGTYSDGRSQLLKLDKRAENLEGLMGVRKYWVSGLEVSLIVREQHHCTEGLCRDLLAHRDSAFKI